MGLAAIVPEASAAYQNRLARELEQIIEQGFAPLFLLVADIVRFAREREIPVSTRGSVANSLVAYALGITTVDPVALDLVALRLMGFDWQRVPKVRESLESDTLRVTEVRDPADVTVWESREQAGGDPEPRSLDQIRCDRTFEPHPGWRGHIELKEEA